MLQHSFMSSIHIILIFFKTVSHSTVFELVCLLLIMVLLHMEELCLKSNFLELGFFCDRNISNNKEKLLGCFYEIGERKINFYF